MVCVNANKNRGKAAPLSLTTEKKVNRIYRTDVAQPSDCDTWLSARWAVGMQSSCDRQRLPTNEFAHKVRKPVSESSALANTTRNFLLFRSELFLYHQEDDQIGQWFVGGDCTGWLYARLLPFPNITHETDPTMEDWGWYASIRTIDSATSIALLIYPWTYLDYCWLVAIKPRRKLLRLQSDTVVRNAVDYVADVIDDIMAGDERFESFGWREENPFDTGVTDPRT